MFGACEYCLWGEGHAPGCPANREYFREDEGNTEMPRTRKYSPAIDSMIDSFDGADPFGSAMSMAWAVAEVGRVIGHPEPGQTLNYRPSALAGNVTLDEYADNPEGDFDYETQTLAGAVRTGQVTEADLTFAARVLSRYIDLCRKAARDY